MADRLREGLPNDLQDLDLLIRKALEDPAVRARVEKVLPPEAQSGRGAKPPLPPRPLGLHLASARGGRRQGRRQASLGSAQDRPAPQVESKRPRKPTA